MQFLFLFRVFPVGGWLPVGEGAGIALLWDGRGLSARLFHKHRGGKQLGPSQSLMDGMGF